MKIEVEAVKGYVFIKLAYKDGQYMTIDESNELWDKLSEAIAKACLQKRRK